MASHGFVHLDMDMGEVPIDPRRGAHVYDNVLSCCVRLVDV